MTVHPDSGWYPWAILFDVDGTLVDTESLSYWAWHRVYEWYGVTLTPDQWVKGWNAPGAPSTP